MRVEIKLKRNRGVCLEKGVHVNRIVDVNRLGNGENDE